ncbi:MAG: hypothetical protein JW797_12130 [Bradymonadales bacterium]|nr:hypothetical protein [Bradymonadales bacterium]
MIQLKPLQLIGLIALIGLVAQAPQPVFASTDPPGVQPSPFEVGALIGGGLYQINTPSDPPGSTTFLYGSAFSGGGFTLGATGAFSPRSWIGVELDLLYSWSSVLGLAESSSVRREVTFTEHALRMALLARFQLDLFNPSIELAFGPELAWSIGASASEVVTGTVNPDDPPIEVTTQLSLLPVFQLGACLDLGSFALPVAVRLGWNLFYPETTAERFEGFNGPEDPGAFIVGVDWYLVGLVGVRFGL